MNLIWVPRKVWGASGSTESFIANRRSDPPEAKTEIQVHHTAAVDTNDSTPNRWSYAEAVTYMRRLQWSRPDLGPLPYSENLAVAEDLNTVWVFEGRGILKRGAHTGGHNVAGVGFGVFGNFDQPDVPAARLAVEAIESRVGHYRRTITPYLGDVKNPNGWNAWGHRDSSTKTCPGHSLYPLLADFKLEEPMITQWLPESGFRQLYDLGVVQGASADAVVQYWVTERAERKLQEHIDASSNILVALGGLQADHDHDGRYIKNVSVEK